MNTLKLGIGSLVSVAALVAGCAGAEEYEVTGEVSSAQTVSGPISLEFFEVAGDAATAPESVLKVELAQLGKFSETVEVSADSKIMARALVDADGNGSCTEGELWAETTVQPKDDGTVAPLTLALAATACPAAN